MAPHENTYQQIQATYITLVESFKISTKLTLTNVQISILIYNININNII